jgi:lysozyme
VNPRAIARGLVLVSVGAATFIAGREGMRENVYADVGGVPTVCAGVVVKGVAIGTHYTRAQCDELTRQSLEKHALGLAACTVDQGAKLAQHQFDAFLSLAYNVGVASVCASCLPGKECLGDLIRAGKTAEACERILAYGKVRINGELRDCSDPRHGCRGVWVRRIDERKLCLGDES